MTSSTAATSDQQNSLLGTLIIVPWANEPAPGSNGAATPFLLVCSRGDGRDGPGPGAKALRAELEKTGLWIGEGTADLTRKTQSPVTLLVEAGRAVLSMPFLHVQCPVTPNWEKAAHESGTAYLICTVRPWPEAVQGMPVGADQLREFVSDEQLVPTSARCLLPVRRVRT
ncbi:DUF5949 family protein [Streptomyces iconiensis]|uniref:DUF5949 family protein n=1 Tax=Streptomyces iconiensis TaxID=1384038 RepID=A0ABT7A1M0_9ACTN|nr:DUF5949 family protein [Streptomyces iconiensis]MDJ1135225.1 DUF5949 family protein [Streptomyces iconiensis]